MDFSVFPLPPAFVLIKNGKEIPLLSFHREGMKHRITRFKESVASFQQMLPCGIYSMNIG